METSQHFPSIFNSMKWDKDSHPGEIVMETRRALCISQKCIMFPPDGLPTFRVITLSKKKLCTVWSLTTQVQQVPAKVLFTLFFVLQSCSSKDQFVCLFEVMALSVKNHCL